MSFFVSSIKTGNSFFSNMFDFIRNYKVKSIGLNRTGQEGQNKLLIEILAPPSRISMKAPFFVQKTVLKILEHDLGVT